MAETQDKHYHIGQAIWNASHPITGPTINLLNDNPGDDIKNVVKLGITTIPGVKFALNYTNDINNNNTPVVEIGRTGFFELDVKDLAMTINSIVIDSTSETINDETKYIYADIINENYCYIDFIYYD